MMNTIFLSKARVVFLTRGNRSAIKLSIIGLAIDTIRAFVFENINCDTTWKHRYLKIIIVQFRPSCKVWILGPFDLVTVCPSKSYVRPRLP